MAVYTVQKGDTLSSIAKKLGYSNWQDLYNSNKSVIGSNPNLIYSGTQLNYGNTNTPSTNTASTNIASQGTTLGTQAGQSQPKNFQDILAFSSDYNPTASSVYYDPNLVQSSTEQLYSNYYAPIVEQAQQDLANTYANRGLIQSGLRGQATGNLYQQYGSEQAQKTLADVLQQKANAQQEYNLIQQLYENSNGSTAPTSGTKYTPYTYQQPTTSAGKYGKTYLDWLNQSMRSNT